MVCFLSVCYIRRKDHLRCYNFVHDSHIVPVIHSHFAFWLDCDWCFSLSVYEGEKSFYKEDDIAFPVNVYGKTKVEAEKFISEQCSNFAILRSSIIYGPQTISPVPKSLPIQVHALYVDFLSYSVSADYCFQPLANVWKIWKRNACQFHACFCFTCGIFSLWNITELKVSMFRLN